MKMVSEMLQVLMDMLDLNDRQVAKKLGVTHKTVFRWRTGQEKISVSASLAMDCVFGSGNAGSARIKATEILLDKWRKFSCALSRRDLCSIAEGPMAVIYKEGNFFVGPYRENSEYVQVYVGDICGVGDYPNEWKHQILSLFFPREYILLEDALGSSSNQEHNNAIDALVQLVGESTRSDLLQYDIQHFLLEAICQKNENNLHNLEQNEY